MQAYCVVRNLVGFLFFSNTLTAQRIFLHLANCSNVIHQAQTQAHEHHYTIFSSQDHHQHGCTHCISLNRNCPLNSIGHGAKHAPLQIVTILNSSNCPQYSNHPLYSNYPSNCSHSNFKLICIVTMVPIRGNMVYLELDSDLKFQSGVLAQYTYKCMVSEHLWLQTTSHHLFPDIHVHVYVGCGEFP